MFIKISCPCPKEGQPVSGFNGWLEHDSPQYICHDCLDVTEASMDNLAKELFGDVYPASQAEADDLRSQILAKVWTKHPATVHFFNLLHEEVFPCETAYSNRFSRDKAREEAHSAKHNAWLAREKAAKESPLVFYLVGLWSTKAGSGKNYLVHAHAFKTNDEFVSEIKMRLSDSGALLELGYNQHASEARIAEIKQWAENFKPEKKVNECPAFTHWGAEWYPSEEARKKALESKIVWDE